MTSDRLVAVSLGVAGALGGAIWTAIPTVSAVSFYGIETGVLGLDRLTQLGALIQFAGLSVVGLLAGTYGLYRWFAVGTERWGRRGAITAAVGFVLLLPGSVIPSGWLGASLDRIVPLVFFAGLVTIAIGSVGIGLGAHRSGRWPTGLAPAFGLAIPMGAAVGGVVAFGGAGTIAFVIGLMAPYGLVWVAVGGWLAARAS